MSGGGGFYEYHCKYWKSHDCDQWVYVNNTACTYCIAAGRDATESWTLMILVPGGSSGVDSGAKSFPQEMHAFEGSAFKASFADDMPLGLGVLNHDEDAASH